MADKTGKTWLSVGDTDDPDPLVESYTADGAVTKGLPAYLSADGKVKTAAAAQNCIGVPLETIADGKACPVLTRGRVKVTAGAAIARGQAVYGSDADGKVLPLADQAVDEGGTATYTVYYSRKLAKALQTADAEDDLIFIEVGK